MLPYGSTGNKRKLPHDGSFLLLILCRMIGERREHQGKKMRFDGEIMSD